MSTPAEFPSCVRRDQVQLQLSPVFSTWMIVQGFGPYGPLECELLCMGWEI